MANIKFDERCKQSFLKSYRVNGLLTHSAQACGVSIETIRQHRKRDPEFEAELGEALETYKDSLEEEAHRRGVSGIRRDIYYKGAVVGHELHYSDRMLELKLKRHIPEYRDKGTMDLNVSGGVLVVPNTSQSSEDWEKGDKEPS